MKFFLIYIKKNSKHINYKNCFSIQNHEKWRKPFFLTILADIRRFTTIYLLTKKIRGTNKIERIYRMTKNNFGLKLQTFRSDNGGEYAITETENFPSEMEI